MVAGVPDARAPTRLRHRGRPRRHQAAGRRGRPRSGRPPPLGRQALGLDQARARSTRSSSAVEEARDAVGGTTSPRSASASRARSTARTGVAVYSTHLPLADIPFAAVMSERLGLPVVGGQRRELRGAGRGALRRGAGRRTWCMLTLGTGIGGGLVLRRASSTAAAIGARRRARPHGRSTWTGRRARATAPTAGCLEVMASGTALVREAALRVGAPAGHARSGRALEEGRELTGPLVTELAHDGDPVARGRDRGDRPRARRRAREPRQHLRPGGDRDRRRRDRGGRDAARAGARGDARARAAPGARRRAGRGGARSAPRRG